MGRASHCHQADGADSHNHYGIAKLDVGIFRSGKSSGHHVHTHQCLFQAQSRRDLRQGGVRIWNQKFLRKDAWLASAQLMAGKWGAGVLKITLLDATVPPVRGNCRNCHNLAWFEIFYQLTYFQHLCHALMT